MSFILGGSTGLLSGLWAHYGSKETLDKVLKTNQRKTLGGIGILLFGVGVGLMAGKMHMPFATFITFFIFGAIGAYSLLMASRE